ncbi:MAG: hypothetical protein J1E62_03240 [Lachnospiraceae bacterium]|nr:hypothetical protein [Lachnospiraceae bacterium]
MKKYLLNINSGVIHDGKNPCHQGKTAADFNKKEFDKLSDAMNYFEGKGKKGRPCEKCLKDHSS